MKRYLVSSGSEYEEPIGFSRAVRIGNIISVSGTAPIAEDGSTAYPNDLYNQTKKCIEIIRKAIMAIGFSIWFIGHCDLSHGNISYKPTGVGHL